MLCPLFFWWQHNFVLNSKATLLRKQIRCSFPKLKYLYIYELYLASKMVSHTKKAKNKNENRNRRWVNKQKASKLTYVRAFMLNSYDNYNSFFVFLIKSIKQWTQQTKQTASESNLFQLEETANCHLQLTETWAKFPRYLGSKWLTPLQQLQWPVILGDKGELAAWRDQPLRQNTGSKTWFKNLITLSKNLISHCFSNHIKI